MYHTWSMKDLATCIRERQKNEYDANIMVDGPRGNGKSTFIFKLFNAIGGFKPQQDIVFSRDDVMEGLKDKRFGLIMADEMINSAHNREFFSGDQKELIRMLNMYRDNHNVLAGAVPFFYDIDPQVRKFIKMRVTVVSRGVAIVQFARNSMYSNDPWETDVNKKIEMRWVNAMRRGKNTKPNFKLLTTFAGYVYYGALTPKQEELYKTIKRQKRQEMMEAKDPEEQEKENTAYEKLYNWMINGNVNEEMINSFALFKGIKPESVKMNLSLMHKERTGSPTISNYIKKVALRVSSNSNQKIKSVI